MIPFSYGRGGRTQSGLARSGLRDSDDRNTIYYPRLGTVLCVRYPEDPTSFWKDQISYDILMDAPRERQMHVRALHTSSNVMYGDEVVLRSAYADPNAVPTAILDVQDATKLDGERVLVGYADGIATQPFILGTVIPKLARISPKPWALKKPDGVARKISHKGTTVYFKQTGELVIEAAPGVNITIGNLAGTAHTAAWGDNIRTELDALWTAMSTHIHAGVTTGGGVTGVSAKSPGTGLYVETKQVVESAIVKVKG